MTRILRHILIVDRDPEARLAMSIALRHAGYKVSSARDENEALLQINSPRGKKTTFDLVILDMDLSGHENRKLADALNHDSVSTPSLVISNFSDKAFFIDMISHGHMEFIDNLCHKGQAEMRIWEVVEPDGYRRAAALPGIKLI
ncbi:MAG TPA: response regulator [Dissulfurispiraceae bacterium]|nr:response regulator [Dissulfurispiraceae bacterium]